MNCTKNKSKFKMIFIILGAIGVGAIGVELYRRKKIARYKKIDLSIFEEELCEIIKTDSECFYKLINVDSDTLTKNSLTNVFELESLKMMQELYYKSRRFKLEETREFAKNLYIYNIKLIESYLGRLSDEDVIKSSRNLNRSIEQITSILQANHMDNLHDAHYIQEDLVLNINEAIKDRLSENCDLTHFILKQSYYTRYK